MKIINNSLYCLLALSFLLFACSNASEKKGQEQQTNQSLLKQRLDLTMKSATIILPISSPVETSAISGNSEIRYPLEYVDAVTKRVGNSAHVTFLIQWPGYTSLSWKDRSQRVFLIPGDTLKITKENENFIYEGKSASINAYLRAKEKAFGITDFTLPKAMLLTTGQELDSLGPIVDEMSQKEIDFLQTYAKEFDLPTWYVDYAYYDIFYFGGVLKLHAPGYRADLLNLKEKPSADYYDFLDDIPVHNPKAALSANYYEFLYHLTNYYYITDSLDRGEINEWLPSVFTKSFKFYDEQLEAPIKEHIYMYVISKAIVGDYPLEYDLIQSSIHQIDDTLHQTLMFDLLLEQAKKSIPKGSLAPNFDLPNEKEKQVSLKEFKGQVVLLSFWATWCKPCLKEIPFENELIKSLEGQNFKLVSICMGSNRTLWQSSLEKYQLKAINLYADREWQEKIYEQYKIHGLPHYTLIDSEGRIIEYKTDRPSEDSLALKIANALVLRQSDADPYK